MIYIISISVLGREVEWFGSYDKIGMGLLCFERWSALNICGRGSSKLQLFTELQVEKYAVIMPKKSHKLIWIFIKYIFCGDRHQELFDRRCKGRDQADSEES